MKWQVVEMTSRWNDKKFKWQVDEMTIILHETYVKWKVGEIATRSNNKLECLSLAKNLHIFRWGVNKSTPTGPLGYVEALCANIALGSTCRPVTNTLAYHSDS